MTNTYRVIAYVRGNRLLVVIAYFLVYIDSNIACQFNVYASKETHSLAIGFQIRCYKGLDCDCMFTSFRL